MRPSFSRVVGLFAVCCGAVLLLASGVGVDVAAAQGQPAERDATTERVERAEQDYQQRCEAARERLVEALNQAVFRAADDGDLEELEALEAQRDAFEERGELPPARAVRRDALAYHRALERAADELGRVYERAIREYTRERRIELARAMRTKLALLESGVTLEKVEYNGHTYAVVTEGANWEDARAFCLALGGDLVRLDDREETEFVADLAREAGLDRIWLGASDAADEGMWVWPNGDGCLVVEWTAREPNGGRRENYAEMFAGSKTWNDVPGNITRGYVCEWPGESSEEDDQQ